MNQTQNTTLLDFTGFVNEELNIDQQDTLDQNFRSNLADTSISQIYQKSPFGITTINEKQDQIFNNNDLLEETDDEMSSNQIQKKEVEQIKNKNKSNTSKNQQSNNTKSKKNNNIVSNSSKQIEEEKSEKKSKKERQYSPILKDIQINEDKPNQHQIKFSQQENNKQEDVKDYNYFKRKILKYEYLYNAQFDENEGLFLEFKDYYFSNKDDNNGNKNQDIVINKTIRTILSFLNSYGGFIVFGINDEKYVKGSNMNMDQFANSITPLLVKCQPSVNDKHYMFHEINLKDNSKKKIMVIQVYPQNYKIFLNQNDNYFRRTNASVISYETSDFVDIVKSNYKSKYNVKFEQIKIKLEEQRKKKIQEEKQKIRDQQKKDYINLLEFIKKQTDINKIIGAIDFKLSELQNE